MNDASSLSTLSEQIIGSAIEVHRHLGPGLIESVYAECLAAELKQRSLDIRREVVIPVRYKGVILNKELRLDLLVENLIVVETKAVNELLPVHTAQLLTYLRLMDKRLGLLLNFNVPALRRGIKRVANQVEEE